MNNKIVIVTAPSGSGKSTIVHAMMRELTTLQFSVSATTRQARGTEQDGVDYYFLSVEEFQQRIEHEAFLEWEMVYENKYYGTLHKEIKRIQKNNNVPILDIDVKGALAVQQTNYEVCSIFIEVPNLKVLRERLIKRNTDTAEQIEERLNKAAEEIKDKHQFKHIVLNENLEVATQQVIDIVRSFIKV